MEWFDEMTACNAATDHQYSVKCVRHLLEIVDNDRHVARMSREQACVFFRSQYAVSKVPNIKLSHIVRYFLVHGLRMWIPIFLVNASVMEQKKYYCGVIMNLENE